MRIPVYVLATALLGLGCGDPADEDPEVAADRALTCDGRAPYAARGPWEAGVTRLEVGGRAVEVWYPAEPASAAGRERDRYDIREWLPDAARRLVPDAEAPLFEMDAYRDVPPAGTELPVVVFSHGMAGYRMQSSFLMTHLASWGFVVAAPEHPERGLKIIVEKGFPEGDDSPAAVRATVELLRAEQTRRGGLLEGRLDLGRMAVTGHSAGAAAVLGVAADPEWVTWITYASGGFGTGGGPGKPSLMMGGTSDGIADMAMIEKAYLRQAPGKRLVAVAAAGHLGFTDICSIGRERGGPLRIALDHGIEVPDLVVLLGEDGCRATDLASEQVWPVVDHFTVAHLRAAFGIDAEPVGLDDEAVACFGDRIARFAQE